MANRWGNSDRLFFLDSKITADDDYHHAIKRPLLLGRKAVINLISSVTQLCLTLCNPRNCNILDFPARDQLLELTETHVHLAGDVIQPSHLLRSLSPLAFNISQHQGLYMSQFFSSGGPSIEASASASVLPINIQDWFPLGLTDLISLLSTGLSRVFSNTTVQKYQLFGTQLYL